MNEQRGKQGSVVEGASSTLIERSALLSYAWYEFCKALNYTTLMFGFSMRVEGGRHIPPKGPALLIANHQSFLDPVLVGMASPRHLRFLARKTLFRHRGFAWLIRSLHAVPVDQEGVAKEGLKAILGQLEAGQAVLVFPEGERSPDGTMLPFKPGVQLLIKRARAPILPIGIAGAYDALPRTRNLPQLSPLFWPAGPGSVAVSIGRPLDGNRFAELPRERLLTELFAEVKKVADRAEQLRRTA